MTALPPNRPPDDAAVLTAALSWRHTEAGWRRVEEALELVDAAVAQGDPTALRRAFTALRLCGPTRVATGVNPAMGTVPTRPAPETVRYLVNKLVPTLDVPPETTNKTTDKTTGKTTGGGADAGTEDEPRPGDV
jgi:hypothetical protein